MKYSKDYTGIYIYGTPVSPGCERVKWYNSWIFKTVSDYRSGRDTHLASEDKANYLQQFSKNWYIISDRL